MCHGCPSRQLLRYYRNTDHSSLYSLSLTISPAYFIRSCVIAQEIWESHAGLQTPYTIHVSTEKRSDYGNVLKQSFFLALRLRDEVAGEWRKLHNEELHDLYSSESIIRIMKSRRMMGGACSTNGGEEERV
jgi:hypothetical protein